MRKSKTIWLMGLSAFAASVSASLEYRTAALALAALAVFLLGHLYGRSRRRETARLGRTLMVAASCIDHVVEHPEHADDLRPMGMALRTAGIELLALAGEQPFKAVA